MADLLVRSRVGTIRTRDGDVLRSVRAEGPPTRLSNQAQLAYHMIDRGDHPMLQVALDAENYTEAEIDQASKPVDHTALRVPLTPPTNPPKRSFAQRIQDLESEIESARARAAHLDERHNDLMRTVHRIQKAKGQAARAVHGLTEVSDADLALVRKEKEYQAAAEEAGRKMAEASNAGSAATEALAKVKNEAEAEARKMNADEAIAILARRRRIQLHQESQGRPKLERIQ